MPALLKKKSQTFTVNEYDSVHTGDPASVVAVREHELAAIQDWVAAFNDAYAHTIA